MGTNKWLQWNLFSLKIFGPHEVLKLHILIAETHLDEEWVTESEHHRGDLALRWVITIYKDYKSGTYLKVGTCSEHYGTLP